MRKYFSESLKSSRLLVREKPLLDKFLNVSKCSRGVKNCLLFSVHFLRKKIAFADIVQNESFGSIHIKARAE